MTTYKANFPFRADEATPKDLLLPSPDQHLWDNGNYQADNNLRAGFAAIGIVPYAERVRGGEDLETTMQDFIGDFMHLCDAVNVDFENLVNRAAVHYSAETRGEF